MKLTDEQIWKCNIADDGSAHICMAYQNVIPFAHAIEREIGFTKAELWLKRIDDAVKAEREACAKVCDERAIGWKDVNFPRNDTYAAMHTAAKHEARALAEAIRERNFK
jgi:hypothetical protein